MLTTALFLFMQQAAAPAAAQAPAAPAPASAPAPTPAPAPAATPVQAVPAPAAAPAKEVVPPPELLQVKNIYILPMGGGFDQYLANQLSRKGLVQVVTDPAKADAILADRLGKPFEKAFNELYPEPKPTRN